MEYDEKEDELQKAEDELANMNPDKAIDHFKHAWEHAQKAIDKANGEGLGKSVTGGIYLARIQAGTFNQTIRMLYSK